MFINSNRLNAFYTINYKHSKIENFYSFFVQLNYDEEISAVKRQYQTLLKKDEAFFKSLLSNKHFSQDLNELMGMISARQVLYCVALVYCYSNRDKSVSNFQSFMLLILLKGLFLDNLKIEDRALRLKRKPKIFKKQKFTSLLNLFKRSLGCLMQSQDFSFVKLSPQEVCDIFDGRLFSMVYIFTSTSELGDFWVNLLQKPDFNRQFTKCVQFLDNHTVKFSSQKLTETFRRLFEEKVFGFKDIERMCFRVKTITNVNKPLQISAFNHPLVKRLFGDLFPRVNRLLIEQSPPDVFESRQMVERFLTENNWKDNHRNYKFGMRFETMDDEVLRRIREFNIRSLNKPVGEKKGVEISSNELERIQKEIVRGNFDVTKMEAMYNNYEPSLEFDRVFLMYLFIAHKKYTLAKNHKKHELAKLGARILAKADQVWAKVNTASGKSLTINLIYEILNYFGLSQAAQKLKAYVKSELNMNLSTPTDDRIFKMDDGEVRVQMSLLGEHLKRDERSKVDKRTRLFKPDEWQVEFLDAIDRHQSVIIIAPTSTGKTYASFYAFERVIMARDDSVVIYVAPSKALVNQTASAVMKTFEGYEIEGNKSVCGVFTRDFKADIMNSKVIVTVPQCLFILLINYFNTKWPSTIRYVVFDEIHFMDSEGGNIWEYLFLLIRCPFIALSATVGNYGHLHNWLDDLERFKYGNEERVRLIHFSENHTDLKRYLYTKNGFKSISPLGLLNISMIQKSQQLPNDLNLSPNECLLLYDSLRSEINLDRLDPETSDLIQTNITCSLFVTRNSIRRYEIELKNVLLHHLLANEKSKALDAFKPESVSKIYPSFNKKADFQDKFNDLIIDLAGRDMLPAIVFCNSRFLCEQVAFSLFKYLKFKKLDLKNKSDIGIAMEDGDRDEILTIGNRFKLLKGNIELFQAGIGYHHSGMKADLKSVTESLFRMGKLKVVISTATLALGIHMPCKTVVFMRDDIFLDSFQYRQAAGRAGRRGYDTTGNVVFFDIPYSKVERLVGSHVSELRPHFPLSVTFTMQLFNCVLNSKKPQNIAVDAVLYKSFWNFSYKSKVKQVGYNAVFSLHFLYQLKLINNEGKFSTFSNLLERIHYHEPANFVFYYLLINNVFHQIAQESHQPETDVMFILCHLFNQRRERKKLNILPDLPNHIAGKIIEYNTMAISSYTDFFSYLGKLVREEDRKNNNHCNMLPLTRISFNKTEKQQTAVSRQLSQLMQNWTYNVYSTSPFASLSGVRDDGLLRSDNSLFLNCINELNIDFRVFPLFQLNSNLSDYALEFYKCPSVEDCLSRFFSLKYKFIVNDLYNYLKDFKLLINSIRMGLSDLAPSEDPVRKIFNSLNARFTRQFELAEEYLSRKVEDDLE